jgi:hypothetical protein
MERSERGSASARAGVFVPLADPAMITPEVVKSCP